METTQNRNIKDEIWAIMQIYLNAQQAFRAVKELTKLETDRNRAFVKTRNQFLHYISIVCWRYCVTETCKLTVNRKSEHYNLWQLTKDIQEEKVFEGVKVEDSMLNRWITSLENKKHISEDLHTQRDKIYAHTDRDIGIIGNNVKTHEMEELLDIIFDIIHDLYAVCRNESILKEPTNSPIDDLDWILEALALRDKYFEALEKGA